MPREQPLNEFNMVRIANEELTGKLAGHRGEKLAHQFDGHLGVDVFHNLGRIFPIGEKMKRYLPLLPVEECHVVVFDDPRFHKPDARVYYSYTRRGDGPSESIRREGDAAEILSSLLPGSEPRAIVVEQLKHYPEDLGFVVLRSNYYDTSFFTAIRETLTNSARIVYLLDTIGKQARQLAEANGDLPQNAEEKRLSGSAEESPDR